MDAAVLVEVTRMGTGPAVLKIAMRRDARDGTMGARGLRCCCARDALERKRHIHLRDVTVRGLAALAPLPVAAQRLPPIHALTLRAAWLSQPLRSSWTSSYARARGERYDGCDPAEARRGSYERCYRAARAHEWASGTGSNNNIASIECRVCGVWSQLTRYARHDAAEIYVPPINDAARGADTQSRSKSKSSWSITMRSYVSSSSDSSSYLSSSNLHPQRRHGRYTARDERERLPVANMLKLKPQVIALSVGAGRLRVRKYVRVHCNEMEMKGEGKKVSILAGSGCVRLVSALFSADMHPIWDRQNIARMHDAIRPFAEDAAAGSSNALLGLCNMIPKLPDSQAVLMFPCLFLNLDVTGIPEPSLLDQPPLTPKVLSSIKCAYWALLGLKDLMGRSRMLPLDASPDLWPCMSKWVIFFYTFCEAIHDFHPVDPASVRFVLTTLLAALGSHEQTHELMCSTPGVHRMFAETWKATLQNDKLWEKEVFDPVTDFLNVLTDVKGNPDRFVEVIEGVGGSLDDLVAAVAAQFLRACAQLNYAKMDIFLWLCMQFTKDANNDVLDVALRSSQFSRAIITTLSTLHGAAATKSLGVCFIYVALIVEQPPGYPYIARALKFGLLRVIVMYAASADNNVGKTNQKIAEILQHLVRAALVSYRVVWQLREVFQDAVDLAIELHLDKTQFAEQWNGSPLGVLNSWEAKGRPSYKACSNLKAGFVVCAIKPVRGQSSSVARYARGLTTAPQSVSRSTGGMVTAPCARVCDWQNFSMKTICFRQIEFIHTNPKKPNFLVFVYHRSGETDVNMYPEENTSDDDEKELHLRTGLAQVARSGRRLEIHAVMLYQGRASRRVVVPMHTTSSKLMDGLNSIVYMIPPGWTASEAWDVIEGPIDRLIQAVRRDVIFLPKKIPPPPSGSASRYAQYDLFRPTFNSNTDEESECGNLIRFRPTMRFADTIIMTVLVHTAAVSAFPSIPKTRFRPAEDDCINYVKHSGFRDGTSTYSSACTTLTGAFPGKKGKNIWSNPACVASATRAGGTFNGPAPARWPGHVVAGEVQLPLESGGDRSARDRGRSAERPAPTSDSRERLLLFLRSIVETLQVFTGFHCGIDELDDSQWRPALQP
ncbi:hypothetical protein DFH09DRAFT_1287419 [Mycena vulgaris]|nr:hypothetical protein DFH09DRAFT_1287419 [Mycena vulgaris]